MPPKRGISLYCCTHYLACAKNRPMHTIAWFRVSVWIADLHLMNFTERPGNHRRCVSFAEKLGASRHGRGLSTRSVSSTIHHILFRFPRIRVVSCARLANTACCCATWRPYHWKVGWRTVLRVDDVAYRDGGQFPLQLLLPLRPSNGVARRREKGEAGNIAIRSQKPTKWSVFPRIPVLGCCLQPCAWGTTRCFLLVFSSRWALRCHIPSAAKSGVVYQNLSWLQMAWVSEFSVSAPEVPKPGDPKRV